MHKNPTLFQLALFIGVWGTYFFFSFIPWGRDADRGEGEPIIIPPIIGTPPGTGGGPLPPGGSGGGGGPPIPGGGGGGGGPPPPGNGGGGGIPGPPGGGGGGGMPGPPGGGGGGGMAPPGGGGGAGTEPGGPGIAPAATKAPQAI